MSQGHCNENSYNLDDYCYVAEEPPLVTLVHRYLKVYCTPNTLQIGGLKDN